MYDISEYLNIIGDFSYETCAGQFVLLGTLVKVRQDTNCIVFHARIPIADIHIYDADSIDLHGTINGTTISLLNCHVSEHSYVSDAEYTNAVFELDKIVIGEHSKSNTCIQCISAEMSALNYFYMTHISHFQDKSIEEKFFSDRPTLIAETQYGKVSLQPGLAFESTYHQLVIQSVPRLIYSFNAPKPLDSAISHMASIRNLFSFFADGYLDFNSVEYSSCSRDILSAEESVTVFMNQPSVIPEIDKPFLLTCSTVKDDYQKIVEKWLEFYENSIYIPSLFFEIITNRAKGINEFLNLAQAVEIYSSYFRNEQAKIVCNNDPEAEIKDKPSLKHRLTDIFSYLQTILNISNEQRDCLARNISKNRNFYTHYSSKGKEPSFITVSRMIVLLRFVLLALVYKHIGVADQAIRSCKSRGVYAVIDESINIILLNEHRTKSVLS